MNTEEKTKELREGLDGILNNSVLNWRFEHELIKNETLDQILSYLAPRVYLRAERELPLNPYPQDIFTEGGDSLDARFGSFGRVVYDNAQQDMLTPDENGVRFAPVLEIKEV